LAGEVARLAAVTWRIWRFRGNSQVKAMAAMGTFPETMAEGDISGIAWDITSHQS